MKVEEAARRFSETLEELHGMFSYFGDMSYAWEMEQRPQKDSRNS